MQTRNCPICNSLQFDLFMKSEARNNRDGIDLLKCKNCQFVFSKFSAFDYKELGQNANILKLNKDELLDLALKQKIDVFIDDLGVTSNFKVLDFGSGIGLTALYLKYIKKCDVYSIEKSQAFLEKQQELGLKSFAELTEIKDSFDLIILKDVLEHVDDPVALVKELTEYLKPEGYFFVRVPNRYHYPFYWAVDTKAHINHFTPKNLDTLFFANNMQKIKLLKIRDIRTKFGQIYNFVFWSFRKIVPLYHQISVLYKKNKFTEK